jgi:hypothetical protein
MSRPPKPSPEHASDNPKEELEENARESGVENPEEAVEEYQDSEAHYGRDD